MKGINIEKHFSLTSSNDVQDICNPILNTIGITYFNYIKIYHDDCSRELLTNNANWIKHFYDLALYNSVGAIDIEHLLPKGYFLWSELDVKDPIYLQGRDFFNIDNGISFVIKRPDVTYLYIFASTQENHAINNFYSANIDLLKRFIHYFTDKGQHLIQKAENNKIYLPEKQIINPNRVNNIILDENIRNEFLEQTQTDRYFLLNESDKLYLTQRQAKIMTLFIDGYSSKKIANILNISPKTVENYLYEIKDKVQNELGECLSKEQISQIIRQSNIIL